MKCRVQRILVTVAGCALLSHFTIAEPAVTKSVFSLSLEELMELEVVTARKRSESKQDLPGTVTRVNRKLIDDMGEELRRQGDAFGATTGRPRRCGWLDLIALRHAVRVNGVTDAAITKLDVLDEISEIKVCIGYELDGETYDEVPLDLAELAHVKPVYESFEGWHCKSTGATTFDELPKKAQEYLKYIADTLEVEIVLVSTGAKRKETINLFN